jgi:hypothetical protein
MAAGAARIELVVLLCGGRSTLRHIMGCAAVDTHVHALCAAADSGVLLS